jgi:carbon monoxide dehydrogenase subunit G
MNTVLLASENPQMLIKILIAVAVVLVVAALLFAIAVSMQPSDFVITRSTTIDAPPAAVFAEVNDFHRWQPWSPWEKLDPNLKRTYEGPTAGEGAKYAWEGDGNVGAGQMTITESKPSEQILIKLEFIRPFAGVNQTVFDFQPKGDQTAVTWTMSGKYHWCAKAMGMFMSMDKMIGGNFDDGLASMKSVVEGSKS